MSENTEARTQRRVVEGVVKTDKMNKTIKVAVVRQYRHQKYEKLIRRTTIYIAHDELNEAKVGDTVRLMQTRKLSKTKTWRLIEIVKRAEVSTEKSAEA